MRRVPTQQKINMQFTKNENVHSEPSSSNSLNFEEKRKTQSDKIPAPTEEKMEEKTPGCINIEEIMDEKQKLASNQIDLSEEKKTKTTYDIDDTIIRDIKLSGDIHVRLLSNINGYFIDIRKYQRGFPTKKGIRFLASKFALAVDYLKQDLNNILPFNP
jgi:hypothetical protein